MVMTWLPGDFSAIHDHGLAQWGAVQCFGQAEHYTYELDRLHLCHEEALPYESGQVRLVMPSLIHQMGNAGTERFLSLHVYGCRDVRPAITASARVFELDEGCIQFTNGGVFFGFVHQRTLDVETAFRFEGKRLLPHRGDKVSRFPLRLRRSQSLTFHRPALAPVGAPLGLPHRQLLLVPALQSFQRFDIVAKTRQFVVEERAELT